MPVKSTDEQAADEVLKTRELLMRQRSQTAKAMRANMAKLGIIPANRNGEYRKADCHFA